MMAEMILEGKATYQISKQPPRVGSKMAEIRTRASKEKVGSGREKMKGHMRTGVATLNINTPEGKSSSTWLNQ